MQKTISTQSLKARVGEIVDAVRLRGDRYIIQRRGKPVAALVPLHVNDDQDQKRKELFALIRSVHEKNREIPEEKIQEAIEQASNEVRRARRSRTRKSRK